MLRGIVAKADQLLGIPPLIPNSVILNDAVPDGLCGDLTRVQILR